ncbi:uroporphyrinogen-III C-methyltransferase [Parvibaculum sp.]|uniref:uroporphyrinogen-III C-methyltransferase n=1 Tax=Parvibaculum sp. TaxID=2024848 RepID=UPI000C98F7CF|nr:uroporphyrinogen-III C-methyltransferase [Parvibaculum sp.]MAB14480.1 uroporphyrinogen-III C-methyltransferase [Parvibaculum sp.]
MNANRRSEAQVSFVGAGPGDPELLTLRALQRLQSAEVVLHDALVPREILDLVAPEGRLLSVGKRAGRHSMPQSRINALLVRLALRGYRVVRLKGGDPAVFGRLAEETEALSEAGVSYEVVPGITAASAAAASSGISLTLRGSSRRVQFVTGHTEGAGDFDPVALGLCDPEVTGAIYMARKAVPKIREGFLAAGWSGETNVLIVGNAGRADEVHIRSRLSFLAQNMDALPSNMAVILLLGEAINRQVGRHSLVSASANNKSPRLALGTANPRH